MTGFLVNLLSPVFSSLGVSQADLTSYIEKLIGLSPRIQDAPSWQNTGQMRLDQ